MVPVLLKILPNHGNKQQLNRSVVLLNGHQTKKKTLRAPDRATKKISHHTSSRMQARHVSCGNYNWNLCGSFFNLDFWYNKCLQCILVHLDRDVTLWHCMWNEQRVSANFLKLLFIPTMWNASSQHRELNMDGRCFCYYIMHYYVAGNFSVGCTLLPKCKNCFLYASHALSFLLPDTAVFGFPIFYYICLRQLSGWYTSLTLSIYIVSSMCSHPGIIVLSKISTMSVKLT